MTCIVALKFKKTVLIGADDCLSWNDERTSVPGSKSTMFGGGAWCIAGAGHLEESQRVFRYFKQLRGKIDIDRLAHIVCALDMEPITTWLVANKGNMWLLIGDGAYIPLNHAYYAIGNGADMMRGYLSAHYGSEPGYFEKGSRKEVKELAEDAMVQVASQLQGVGDTVHWLET